MKFIGMTALALALQASTAAPLEARTENKNIMILTIPALSLLALTLVAAATKEPKINEEMKENMRADLNCRLRALDSPISEKLKPCKILDTTPQKP